MRKLHVVETLIVKGSVDTRFPFVIKSRLSSRDLPRILKWRKSLQLYGVVFYDNLGAVLLAMIDHDTVRYEVHLGNRIDALLALPIALEEFATI